MVAPDHKPELLEDQEAWMREWVSMKVSVLFPIGMLLYLCIIFQTNLEVCTMCTTELGVESLDMSAECVEFLKRGCKVFEVIVKGWKVMVVEVASEVLPKKCVMRAFQAQATDTSGTAKADLSMELLVTGTLSSVILATSNPLPFELEAWTSDKIISSLTVTCFEAGCGCGRVLGGILMPSKRMVFPFPPRFWSHFAVTYASASCIRFTISSSSPSSKSWCMIMCINAEDPTSTMALISELA